MSYHNPYDLMMHLAQKSIVEGKHGKEWNQTELKEYIQSIDSEDMKKESCNPKICQIEKQWESYEIEDVEGPPEYCPCGVAIKYKHHIVNIEIQEKTFVGSTCITRFSSRLGAQSRDEIKLHKKGTQNEYACQYCRNERCNCRNYSVIICKDCKQTLPKMAIYHSSWRKIIGKMHI